MLDDNKRYQVTIRLGIMTDTGDAEGKVIAEMPVPEFSEQNLADCLRTLPVKLNRCPPMYSALKHQGKKTLRTAREGKTVERPARQITIFELNLLDFGPDHSRWTSPALKAPTFVRCGRHRPATRLLRHRHSLARTVSGNST